MVVKFEKSLRETLQGTLVQVQVVPKGKEFALIGFDEWTGSLKVRLSKPKEKGKANRELLQKMRGFFGAEVEIAKGEKSQQKTLLVHAEKPRVEESLSALFKGQT
jgi:hypothetical protein